jgi:hypothetical protein
LADVFFTLLVTAGILFTGSDLFCAEIDKDEPVVGRTMTAEVTIQKKMTEGLLTKELQVVRLSRQTTCVDQTGRKIGYDSLAVPCKAVLVYLPELKGDPLAVSITVKRVLPGASSYIMEVPR